jgi:hypothetical protein
MAMSTSNANRKRGMMAAAMLAVLVPACPAPAYDPEAAFARGTTIVGLQVGAGSSTTSRARGWSATSRS